MPAGKAMALAAMPTAVLMGMGLTPTLAQAKPQPKNPFQDGPCVTQPDEPAKPAKPAEPNKDGQDGRGTKGGQGKGEADTGGENTDNATLDRLQDAADQAKDAADRAAAKAKELVEKVAGPAEPDTGGTDGGESAQPAPEPSPSVTSPDEGGFNPLDPLADLGEALKDLVTPDDPAEPGESPAPSPTPTDEAPVGPDPDDVEAAEKAVADAKAKKAAYAKAKKALDEAKAKAAEDAREAADRAKDEQAEDEGTAGGKQDDAAEPGTAKDPMAPDEDGRKPFPCPVEKKVAGKDETTPTVIPDAPFVLEASSLLLKGADYQGVVNVTTASGRTKQVLKYVIKDGVDIGDLHQIIDNSPRQGLSTHVRDDTGGTSTIRGGAVTFYTESLSGKLFGLIPMTFDPEHPPPLDIPLIYLTDVKAVQAATYGGDLNVPGLHLTIE